MSIPPGFAVDPKAEVDESGRPRGLVPTGPLADLGMRLVLLNGSDTKLGPGAPAADPVASFAISETEVTNGQLKSYFQDQKIEPPAEFQSAYQALLANKEASVSPMDADKHPAVGVSRKTAEDFARWAGGDLPTEPQWVYAAQCGGDPKRLFVWEDNQPTVANGGRANLDTLESMPTRTAKVKNFPDDRTDQGVYDMTGNVREWTRSPGRSLGEFVVKGGSYLADALGYTNILRGFKYENEMLEELGFRIVITSPQATTREK